MATNKDIYEQLDKLRRELQDDSDKLADKIDKTYVRIAQFETEVAPLKRFVYGIVAICMAGLLTALLALVLK
jgi:hypothetical protein